MPTAVPSKERNIPILTGSNCLTNKDRTMLKCCNIALIPGNTYMKIQQGRIQMLFHETVIQRTVNRIKIKMEVKIKKKIKWASGFHAVLLRYPFTIFIVLLPPSPAKNKSFSSWNDLENSKTSIFQHKMNFS